MNAYPAKGPALGAAAGLLAAGLFAAGCASSAPAAVPSAGVSAQASGRIPAVGTALISSAPSSGALLQLSCTVGYADWKPGTPVFTTDPQDPTAYYTRAVQVTAANDNAVMVSAAGVNVELFDAAGNLIDTTVVGLPVEAIAAGNTVSDFTDLGISSAVASCQTTTYDRGEG